MKMLCLVLISIWIAGCKLRPDNSLSNTGPYPKSGRSLFDDIIAKAPGQQVPYPFKKLLEHLEKFGTPTAILAPLGRSSQNHIAIPNSFADPRRLVAYGFKTNAELPINGRLFLGYVKAANQIEVIAWNETAEEFEFQVVENYGKGMTPNLHYVERAFCLTCHQHAGPIITPSPWSEFNGSDVVAALLKRYHPSGETEEGIPIDQPKDGSGGEVSYRFESLVSQAASLVSAAVAWKGACAAGQELTCRGDILRSAIVAMLDYKFQSSAILNRSFRQVTEIIPDRDVVAEVLGFAKERDDRFKGHGTNAEEIADFQARKLSEANLILQGFERYEVESLMRKGGTLNRSIATLPPGVILSKEAIPSLESSLASKDAMQSILRQLLSGQQMSPQSLTQLEYFMAKTATENIPRELDPKTQRPENTISLAVASNKLLSAFSGKFIEAVLKSALMEENRALNTWGFMSLELGSKARPAFADLRLSSATISISTGGLTADHRNSDEATLTNPTSACHKVTDEEMTCNFRPSSETAGIKIDTVQVNLPLKEGGFSKSSSTFVIKEGKRVGTYYVLCRNVKASVGRYQTYLYLRCTPWDASKLLPPLEALIADGAAGRNAIFNDDVMKPKVLMNEYLKALNLAPTEAASQNDDLPQIAKAEEQKLTNIQGKSLGLLYEYCGACHTMTSATDKPKNRTLFLQGASDAEVCANLEPYRTRIIKALSSGYGKDSYMPPVRYEKNDAFDTSTRDSLIDTLKSSAWCK